MDPSCGFLTIISLLGHPISEPIKVGSVLALAVALSDLALIGRGPLVIGTLLTRCLAPDALTVHCSMVEEDERWCR